MIMRNSSGSKISRYKTSRESKQEWWNFPFNSHSEKLPILIQILGYSRVTRKWKQCHKNYPSLGVELISAGNGEVKIKDEIKELSPGNLFLKIPGSSFDFITGPAGFMHKRHVQMEGWMIQPWLNKHNVTTSMVIQPESHFDYLRLWKTALSYCKEMDLTTVDRLSEIAYAMLLEMGRQIRTRALPERIKTVIDYMEQNWDQPLDLKHLSKVAGVSPSHFSAIFTTSVGQSPLLYFSRIKFNRAKALLQNQSLSINEIAMMSGVESASHFSRQFRKIFALSPQQYRRGASGR